MYGYAVLCQKCNSDMTTTIEDHRKTIEKLKMQKESILFLEKDAKKAREIYPEFPDAIVLEALQFKNIQNFETQIKMLEDGLKILPGNMKIIAQLARSYLQWDEAKKNETFYSNNVKKSEQYFKEYHEARPGDDEVLYFLAVIEGRYKRDYDKSAEYFNRMLEINPMKFNEVESMKAWVWREKELDKQRRNKECKI